MGKSNGQQREGSGQERICAFSGKQGKQQKLFFFLLFFLSWNFNVYLRKESVSCNVSYEDRHLRSKTGCKLPVPVSISETGGRKKLNIFLFPLEVPKLKRFLPGIF